MFHTSPARYGSVYLPIEGLFSFALSYRIECQYDETFQGQIRGDPLRLRLPLLYMAGLQKDTGIATRLVRQVKIGGDEEPRQTLVNHLLDSEGLVPDAAGNSGIQRSFVVGQTAHDCEDLFADRLFPAFRVGDSANFGNGVLPLLQFLLRNSVHPAEKRILVRPFLPRLQFLPSLKGSLSGIFGRPLGRKRTGAEEGSKEEGDRCKFHELARSFNTVHSRGGGIPTPLISPFQASFRIAILGTGTLSGSRTYHSSGLTLVPAPRRSRALNVSLCRCATLSLRPIVYNGQGHCDPLLPPQQR